MSTMFPVALDGLDGFKFKKVFRRITNPLGISKKGLALGLPLKEKRTRSAPAPSPVRPVSTAPSLELRPVPELRPSRPYIRRPPIRRPGRWRGRIEKPMPYTSITRRDLAPAAVLVTAPAVLPVQASPAPAPAVVAAPVSAPVAVQAAPAPLVLAPAPPLRRAVAEGDAPLPPEGAGFEPAAAPAGKAPFLGTPWIKGIPNLALVAGAGGLLLLLMLGRK